MRDELVSAWKEGTRREGEKNESLIQNSRWTIDRSVIIGFIGATMGRVRARTEVVWFIELYDFIEQILIVPSS